MGIGRWPKKMTLPGASLEQIFMAYVVFVEGDLPTGANRPMFREF